MRLKAEHTQCAKVRANHSPGHVPERVNHVARFDVISALSWGVRLPHVRCLLMFYVLPVGLDEIQEVLNRLSMGLY